MHKPDDMTSKVHQSAVIHHVDFRPSTPAIWGIPASPSASTVVWQAPQADDALSQLKAIGDDLRATMLDDDASRDHTRDVMAACTRAMDEVQRGLVHERARRWQLELDNFDARTALAQLRSQLKGSQAGERRARHLAMHDGLTALPNRHHFLERLEQVMSITPPSASPVAVLYIDLDNFKTINDLHGHGAGDELLSITAARLTRALRADDMVGRLGGDEFACLLMNVPSRQLLGQMACKLFDAISATVKIRDLAFQVRPSIGVATACQAALTAASLLDRADQAMYLAKREQTGYAFYSPDDDVDLNIHLKPEAGTAII
jgi:diguanylate cyclase (GGDEF)-like protein